MKVKLARLILRDFYVSRGSPSRDVALRELDGMSDDQIRALASDILMSGKRRKAPGRHNNRRTYRGG